MRSVLLITLVVLCPAILLPPDTRAESWFEWQETVECDRPIDLTVELTSGRVVIVPGRDHELKIEAVKRIFGRDWDEARALADKIRIEVDHDGDRVSITTNYDDLGGDRSLLKRIFGGGSDSFADVDYRLSVPATRSVRITGREVDIELAGIEGEVSVENKRGSTRAEFLRGPVTVKQTAGEIDLKWIEGDIRVESRTGRVAIKQSRGAIDLVTEQAEVEIQTELDTPKEFAVTTKSGPVTFTVPRTSAGTFVLATETGNIVTDLPLSIKSLSQNKVEGAFGGGGQRIRLTTESGDVTVAAF
jgi:hypothetical protein